MMAYTLSLAESAALAATALPARGAAEAVRRAARQGAVAVERLVHVPLPLLLDVDVLLRAGSFARPLFRPALPHSLEAAAYEEWLENFVSLAARYLGISIRRRLTTDGTEWDLTTLLAAHFHAKCPRPDLYAAFRDLAADIGVQDVLSAWGGTRTTKGWRACYPQELDCFSARNWEPGTWAAFSATKGSEWLDERCDHEAARIYFEAANPYPDLDQSRRIRRLLRRRPFNEPNPLTQSYEDQALYHGAITTATLASGEYGEFMIVNHSDYRISNPPLVHPPLTLNVHMCWIHGYLGLARTLPALVFPNSNQKLDGVYATEVSVLQAFAALLFDDWRSALTDMDVRLHAHCGTPDAARDDFGRPGRRWKPSKTSGPMPPPRVISHFFQRANWLFVEDHGISWREVRSRSAWWCLVLLASELADFRIQAMGGGTLETNGSLSIPRDVLPPCISAVIVLDPAGRDGTVYDVRLPINGMNIHLCPVSTRCSTGKGDSSFESLRLRCLDALLDALEART